MIRGLPGGRPYGDPRGVLPVPVGTGSTLIQIDDSSPLVPAPPVPRRRVRAKAAAARPSAPTTSPAIPSARAVESLVGPLAFAVALVPLPAEVLDEAAVPVESAAFVSVSTGAGWSGAGCPGWVRSIQRTTSP